jgi:hypothetical protein
MRRILKDQIKRMRSAIRLQGSPIVYKIRMPVELNRLQPLGTNVVNSKTQQNLLNSTQANSNQTPRLAF